MKLIELLIQMSYMMRTYRVVQLWTGEGQDWLGHRGEWEDCFLYSTFDVRYPDGIVGIVLLYGSGNRLYYYVDYRLRDIVGDSVNAKRIHMYA